ncbi:PIN domain-containing protein [Trinickia mobilis]|uniref:PIN domain-containing protein n=1 Tax=Trinickia mobilis TaxID=2816356 RepID=UPI001A8F3C43|nr:PIN domain-containing protein [Trinickia mobilis]
MDQAILDDLQHGRIGAIALDTEVFDAKQLNLETGLLKRVAQFVDSEITVLLPDVVASEVEAHLRQAASEAQGKLKRAMRLMEQAQLLSLVDGATPAKQLLERIAEPAAATEVASERLAAWIERSGAVVLHAGEHVTLDQVLLRYFDAKPPFAASGPKKNEFPDAVALLTLEGWAEQQQRKVLVVSNDPDWVRYCATSPGLVVVRDLADALGAFQGETARYACRWVCESLALGGVSRVRDPLNLEAALLYALQMHSERIEFAIEADSQFYFQEDTVEPDFEDVELPDPVKAEELFEAVDYGKGYVVLQVEGTARARVASYFKFQRYYSSDGDYLPMGHGSVVRNEQIRFRALVTLTGDIPARMAVDEVEILTGLHHMELGTIGPDWLGDPDHSDAGDTE